MRISYHIVTGSDAQHLAKNLATFLDDGWVPQGGVSVCDMPVVMGRNREEFRFFQAIIHREPALPVANVVGAAWEVVVVE